MRAKLIYEKKASGPATDMIEIETALEEIIDKEDAAEVAEREDKQKVAVGQVEDTQDIRAETKRRKVEDKALLLNR